MGTFSYTSVKPKRLSMGNRIAYLYKLKDVQTSGSVLHTPFKKITGYLVHNVTPNTTCINVSSNTDSTGPGTRAKLTFAAGAESQGYIIVVGLLG